MVAIKDMDMPRCCFNCDMQIDRYSAGYYCAITEQQLNDNYTLEHRHPNCPLVEIEGRKGRWILIDEESNTWQCSHCIELGKDDWWQLNSGTPQDNKMDYCPHCGAEMVGNENG